MIIFFLYSEQICNIIILLSVPHAFNVFFSNHNIFEYLKMFSSNHSNDQFYQQKFFGENIYDHTSGNIFFELRSSLVKKRSALLYTKSLNGLSWEGWFLQIIYKCITRFFSFKFKLPPDIQSVSMSHYYNNTLNNIG